MEKKKKFHYILYFQYLGFRYHGWQKQKNVKTVQFMLERTLEFVLGNKGYKTLGASRTDSMVSALKSACQITLYEDCEPAFLLEELNKNLPADIKALSIERSQAKFSVINHPKTKTYHYFFSNEKKAWPFAAPYMCNIVEPLNIDLMDKGAGIFEGRHCFKAYCHRPNPQKIFDREVLSSQIAKNDLLQANFFPPESFVYTVKGEGFMRHQIRLMMGALFRLGRGELTLNDLERSLMPEAEPVGFIAPASGLVLGDLDFRAATQKN